ncbi:hypothetical protein IscW_ISCW023015 [Ixodes scapularis]|uniref:Uncharacterized protein n=1 Tax=Ixodes scapularis TaxID=6945 RepID=B7QGU0_IXOSC|nr:hypothetical protein IscW_ISCW023015 [Ixodes scapularis]|eukprot:XP_002414397.1 hypothetical protein IscW_ISCW023015 [Ixodes scapularis]
MLLDSNGDKGKPQKGAVKSLLASSKITDSDLDHKLKSIKKWLERTARFAWPYPGRRRAADSWNTSLKNSKLLWEQRPGSSRRG